MKDWYKLIIITIALLFVCVLIYPVYERQHNATFGIDTWIDSSNADENRGVDTVLQIYCNNAGGHFRRTLIKFDSLDYYLSNSTLVRARIIFTIFSYSDAVTDTIMVYPLTTDWTEGTQIGVGGVCNWDSSDATTEWTTAGGDYDADKSVQRILTKGDYTSEGDTVVIDITDIVALWVDSSWSNYGIIMKWNYEGAQGVSQRIQFYSSDCDTDTDRPKIIMDSYRWDDVRIRHWSPTTIRFQIDHIDTTMYLVLYDSTVSRYVNTSGDTTPTKTIYTVGTWGDSVVLTYLDTSATHQYILGGVRIADSLIVWDDTLYTVTTTSRPDSIGEAFRDTTSLTIYVTDTSDVGIEYYIFDVDTSLAIDTVACNHADGVVQAITITGLGVNSRHYFWIQRRDSGGVTLKYPSSEDSIWTDASLPILSILPLADDTSRVFTFADFTGSDSTWICIYDSVRNAAGDSLIYVGYTDWQQYPWYRLRSDWNASTLRYFSEAVNRVFKAQAVSGRTKPDSLTTYIIK